jgi:hypothetical protein
VNEAGAKTVACFWIIVSCVRRVLFEKCQCLCELCVLVPTELLVCAVGKYEYMDT